MDDLFKALSNDANLFHNFVWHYYDALKPRDAQAAVRLVLAGITGGVGHNQHAVDIYHQWAGEIQALLKDPDACDIVNAWLPDFKQTNRRHRKIWEIFRTRGLKV